MRVILIFLFSVFSLHVLGQSNVQINVIVTDMASKKKESGITMTVYNGSNIVKTAVSPKNGNIDVTIPAGPTYKVVFTKAGKISRFFNLNSSGIDPELIQGSDAPFVYCEVSLFDDVQGVDFSYVKDNPFTVFKFDGKSSRLSFDKDMAAKMSQKIDQLLANAQRQDQNNEVQYQAKMKEGEALASQNKYQDAITKFEQALMFKQGDKVATKRIEDMDKMLTANQVNIANGTALEDGFDELKKQAEDLKNKKQYQDAIDKYNEALNKKRGDQYCLDEIDRLEKIIKTEKEAKENEQKYQQSMTLGTQMFNQKSYETALKYFNDALDAKPKDPTATAKQQQVQKLLDDQKQVMAKKQKYEQLIADADKLYTNKSWDDAKAKYQEALGIESASTYAIGRIKDIDTKIAEAKKEQEKQAQIATLITDGNNLFNQSKWDEAKAKFLAVQQLDKENATAKTQLAAIAEKLAQQQADQAKQKQFDDLVAAGDKAFGTKDFKTALDQYNAAIAIKTDAGVTTKIANTKVELDKIAHAAEIKQKYDEAIKTADDLLSKKDLENAKAKYNEALQLDATQKYPQDKIEEINKQLTANKLAQQKEKDFNDLLVQAKTAFDAGKYDEAKTKYQQANVIKPESDIPPQKIKEIDELLKQNATKKQVTDLLADADKKFAANDYENAILTYKKVLTFDEKNEKALSQIDLCQKAISDLEQKKKDSLAQATKDAAIAKRAADYATALKKGDDLKAQKKYSEAITAYEAAKPFTDDATEANKRIEDVKAIVADAQKAEQAKAIHDKYLAAFNRGVDLQSQQKYDDAITAYKAAKDIDSTQTDPDIKIKEVQNILQGIADSRLKSKKVDSLIASGDEFLKISKFTEAISQYNAAKVLDNANPTIPTKIKNAEELQQKALAAQSEKEKHDAYLKAFQEGLDNMTAENYQAAISSFKTAQSLDPSNKEPQAKIDQINAKIIQLQAQKDESAKTKQYEALINQGETALNGKKLNDAMTAFQSASSLKPDEDYPKKKIEEIKNQMDLDKLQQENLKKEAAYTDLMKKGDDNFNQKNFDIALTNYQEAQKINDSPDVRSKIALVNQQMSDAKKAEANEKLQKEYEGWMSQARKAEDANDFKSALDSYTKANQVKPDELEPKSKMAEMTSKLNANSKQAAIDEQYQAAMKAGDDAFNQAKFNDAIDQYNKALAVKDTQEAKDKIKTSQDKLAELTAGKKESQFKEYLTEARQSMQGKEYNKSLDFIKKAEAIHPNDSELLDLKKQVNDFISSNQEYASTVAKADQATKQKDYQSALALYKTANGLRPSDPYPSQQIAMINGLLQQENNKNNNKVQYEELLSKANNQKQSGDLESALQTAKSAVSLMPNEQEAQTLIAEIQNLIAVKNKQKSDQQLTDQYNSLLSVADNLFEGKKWSEAKIAYEKARVLKPQEKYVNDQIKRCTDELTQDDLNRSRYTAVIATADNDYKLMNYDKAKSGYELALTYDGSQQYPKDKIAEITKLQQQSFTSNGEELKPLGERVDITLAEGAALLAKAEEERRNSKGQVLQDVRNQSVDRKDSVAGLRDNYVGQTIDTFRVTKQNLHQDMTEYHDNMFNTDKKIREANHNQTDLNNQLTGYAYNDNVENTRKFGILDGMKVEQEKSYIDHNARMVDSVRAARGDIQNKYSNDTYTDYDLRMNARQLMKSAETQQVLDKVDESADHQKIVDMTKGQRNIAIENKQTENAALYNKIGDAQGIIKNSDDKNRERSQFFDDGHHELVDIVRTGREDIISKENAAFNDVYAKQLKAKAQVTDAQTLVVNKNKDYLDNKSSDITKAQQRLKEANSKYNADLGNDDKQRDEAQLLINSANDQVVARKAMEDDKQSNINDNIKNIVKDQKTQVIAQNQEKKESIYDTRSQLKTLETAKVIYPAKIANQIGKDYPEGVSQEVYKQNGPDGLPIAIVTRRIVVINGYGNVYTRTQKYGSITYSKNGDPCPESIWINETSDSKLKKNY